MVTLPAQPERDVLRAIALHFDLCKKPIKAFFENGLTHLNPVMVERYGDAIEVRVSLKSGMRNLNGGVGQTSSFDICPRCFEERLQPWLTAQGAEVLVEDWHS